jgi:hypothetical protein
MPTALRLIGWAGDRCLRLFAADSAGESRMPPTAEATLREGSYSCRGSERSHGAGGKVAAITLATRISADLVILDDLAARRVARSLNLGVRGTVGLLEAAWRRGYLPQLRAAFARLREEGIYLNLQILNAVPASNGFSGL